MTRLVVLWESPGDPVAFERHYREVHIPLASAMPGLRRYTVGWDPSPIVGEPYHAVAELDFDDRESLRAAFASPEGRATAADANAITTDLGAARRAMVFEVEEV
ncbi:MAG TPA: EthD family reductase [Actinomycetota bacterium]|nr:EthD family reductase [Actinomycetota bacterium]